MQKKIFTCLFPLTLVVSLFGQTGHPVKQITEMRWGLDYQIYMKMANDSSYMLEVSDLFHITPNAANEYSTEFVYYPVNLGEGFINSVKDRNSSSADGADQKSKTLWSALHQSLGSGWVHFTNCLLYALETENLKLTAPLMKRPETDWKPDPPTETYLRTRKWEFYAPVNQRFAQKEYKTRLKNKQLGDLTNIPPSFIQIFLETNNREYKKMLDAEETKSLAKIDLVKLLLGINYLGEVQIDYIRNSVLNAVKRYSVNKLPSVIIFDEFDAAAAMSLNEKGYLIEEIVFSDQANLRDEEIQQRSDEIHRIIDNINEYNQKSFERRLKNYYQ